MSDVNSLGASDLLCVRGGRTLFAHFSFAVEAGQCVHLSGANGCGKSSLLRILCGLNAPQGGLVRWNGRALDEDYFQVCAYLAHKDALKNQFSVIENLRFYQRLENLAVDESQLDGCLGELGLLALADLPTRALSFGQRRRLAFARLLLKPYAVWVLDEPMTGVDGVGRALLESLCVGHLRRRGIIVLTDHHRLTHSRLVPYLTELSLSEFGAGV